ncbi:hypothetical protein ACNY9Y_000389 [Cronobacter dublinensis]
MTTLSSCYQCIMAALKKVTQGKSNQMKRASGCAGRQKNRGEQRLI